MQKVGQLKEALGKAGVGGVGSAHVDTSAVDRTQVRIREMMERLKASSPAQGDPEMDKLDGMLDKLIRIQHPELVQGDTSVAPGAVTAAVVGQPRGGASVGLLASGVVDTEDQGGFMEIGVRDEGDSGREAAIEAVITTDQTLTAGSTVALRIVQDFAVGGEHIPANQLVYGLASLAGERLTIGITSMRVGQMIVPVSMQVYDLDGLPGIRVPGAITRDVSKESADQALSGLEMASVDPSLGAQAASAGLQFAKSLASRKIRLVRVSLPAGYRVLLKNGKSNIH
jgi:conjugative transposon TraM protein